MPGIIDRILEGLIAVLLLASVVVACLEVGLRYIFNSSLGWSFEFLLILITYMTFIGAYLALRMRAHLRIMVLYLKLGRTGQFILFVLNQLGIGVTVSVMTWWGWDYTFRFPGKSTLMHLRPVAWLYIVVPIAGTAMLFQVAWDLWKGIRRYMNGMPPEDVSIVADVETMDL